MAKCRFPGKALKLNNRKRVKYRWNEEENLDSNRINKFKLGLALFRNIFGDSEEDDDEFSGFIEGKPVPKLLSENGKKNNNNRKESTKKVHSVQVLQEESIDGKELEKEKIEYNGQSASVKINLDNVPKLVVVEPVISKSLDLETNHVKDSELDENLYKRKSKDGERTSKKFVLPSVSSRSSRIIKPNTRLFSDGVNTLCSNDEDKTIEANLESAPRPSLKSFDKDIDLINEDEIEKDPVCRSITLYTDAITEQFKGHVGRPAKRICKKGDYNEEPGTPSKGVKEEKVKEKIEKLLRSPWDKRLKLNLNNPVIKIKEKDGDSTSATSASKSILRKAKLNLNKQTLQKIRSPASVQRLVSQPEEGGDEVRKCGLCLNSSKKTTIKFGVICCEPCHFSVCCFTEETIPALFCQGGQSECQLVGLSLNERCQACWLSRILSTCAMNNVLHDRLRSHLPPMNREKVLTSLGRSLNVNNATGIDSLDDKNSCGFGTIIDLPGGWKRKNGQEVVVISPSGEKFSSVLKLKEHLVRQGINADASVLFGHLKSIEKLTENNSIKQSSQATAKVNNVVVTNLPGGWSRRIKWKQSGDKFDTYVCSPDGRTFRSAKELGSYFKKIGKVDDINKYFPMKSFSKICVNSSDNSETSTMEPHSSSESECKYSKLSDAEKDDISKKKDTNIESVNKRNNFNSKIGSCRDAIIISNFNDSTNYESNASSVEDSSPGDVSAIDLSILSDGFDKTEPERLVIKLPKTLQGESCSTKHKKRKKKKKKRHHSPESQPRSNSMQVINVADIIGDNLTVLGQSNNVNSNTRLPTSPDPAISNISENTANEEMIVIEPFVKNKKLIRKPFANKTATKAVKKLTNFSKQPFGSGWSRRIKWDSEGKGKITYLTSPDGQKIVSSIELMAYFKKAGLTMMSLEYYFPGDLTRSIVPVVETKEEEKSESNVSSIIKDEELHRRVLFTMPKNICGRKALTTLDNSSELLVDGTENDATDAGPRVKHVCRSQAQVLGMPRAVFPTPDKEVPVSKKLKKVKDKIAVQSPVTERVLKKTMWCHKCIGCTTPNCRKCITCLDMKKYGGRGTKKKPCIMRKCLNPQKRTSLPQPKIPKIKAKGDQSDNEKKGSDSDVMSIRLSSFSADSDIADDFDVDIILNEKDSLSGSSADKSIFIPKFRNIAEAKDRTDIQAGKKCVPGATVNIDYWQDYEAEEMLLSGFPIITSVPLQIDSLCFRCGSAGLEELLYCIWCCEGVHPFCLEEGEGPECDEEEAFWICKKCSVCHVCGETAEDLLQCNDCRKHFHVECLGPMSHVSCNTTSDGAWTQHLLSYSWPKQQPLFQVPTLQWHSHPAELVSVYENLELMEEPQKAKPSPCVCLLPTAPSYYSEIVADCISSPFMKREKIVETVQIEDSLFDLEEEGGLCLEDEFEGFEDTPIVLPPKKEDVITLHLNINLERSMRKTSSVPTIQTDEYLALGYCKVVDAHSESQPLQRNSMEISLKRWVRMVHEELFSVMKYPSWKTMHESGLVSVDSWKLLHSDSEDSADEEENLYCIKCVKCEGCGNPNVVNWIEVIQENPEVQSPGGSEGESRLTPFCSRCLELRHSNNYCPICLGCYEDDDFDSKMMECAKCKEWVHSHCEGLSDEWYQILSFLPDSVEYICKVCSKNESSSWMNAVKQELESGLKDVLNGLLSNKYARHLVRIEQRPLLCNQKILHPYTLSIQEQKVDTFSSGMSANKEIELKPPTPAKGSEPDGSVNDSQMELPAIYNADLPIVEEVQTHFTDILKQRETPNTTLVEDYQDKILSVFDTLTDVQDDLQSLVSSFNNVSDNITGTNEGSSMLIDNSLVNDSPHSLTEFNSKDFLSDDRQKDCLDSSTSHSKASVIPSIENIINPDPNNATIQPEEEETVVHLAENVPKISQNSSSSEKNVKSLGDTDLKKKKFRLLNKTKVLSESKGDFSTRRLTRSCSAAALKDKLKEFNLKPCSVVVHNLSLRNEENALKKFVENSALQNSGNDNLLPTTSGEVENSLTNETSKIIKPTFDDGIIVKDTEKNKENFEAKMINTDFGSNLDENCFIESSNVYKTIKNISEEENECSNKNDDAKPMSEELQIPLTKESNDSEPSFILLSSKAYDTDKLISSDNHCTENKSVLVETSLQLTESEKVQQVVENSSESLNQSLEEVTMEERRACATHSIIDNVDSIPTESHNFLSGKDDLKKHNGLMNSKILCPADDKSSVPVARVCKEIDDDYLSSEESSYCGSDTEIESIFDESEEPRTLHDLKLRIKDGKYSSVLNFHIDVISIMDDTKMVNKTQFKSCKSTYIKYMKEKFPWFDVQKPDIFSLINSSRPFPHPSIDHIYSTLVPSERSLSSISRKGSLPNSPIKDKVTSYRIRSEIQENDLRKCILCNVTGDSPSIECGRLLYLGQDEWLHVNCGLWSSEVYEEADGGLQNVYIAVSRGRQIKCSLCNERGATVGCCHKLCQATYHFMCARKNESFFGFDKRIFCNAHVSFAGNSKPIEDLRVGRCVFVNMDFEKKRWRQVLSNKVQVMVGCLKITNLGKMIPDLECEDALIPSDFSTSKLFWSTIDPSKRVRYKCRTKKVDPFQVTGDCSKGTGFHMTIDHNDPIEKVNRQLSIIKDWHKEIERQIWARQSRQTNVIPPHLCPLYRKILSEEKKRKVRCEEVTLVQARRKLFSTSTSCDSNAEDDDVRKCLENILERISDTPENIPQEDVVFDGELITNIVSDGGDMMVSADDNEIISMVLRDLPVIENSTPHSPPSGRGSPLDDLDFLNTYGSEIHQDIDIDQKRDEIFDRQEHFDSSHQTTEPDAQLIYQKIFEACDPQVQDQILARVSESCDAATVDSVVSNMPFLQNSLLSLPGPVSASDFRFPMESLHPPLLFDDNIYNDFSKSNSLSYMPPISMDDSHLALDSHNNLLNCPSEILELNDYLMNGPKQCDSAFNPEHVHSGETVGSSYVLEMPSSDSISGSNIVSEVDVKEVNTTVAKDAESDKSCKTRAFMPNSAHVKEASTHDASLAGCSLEELETQSSEPSSETSLRSSPFSINASTTGNSKKQICRVLPMPSVDSRRNSSCSDQSDAGNLGRVVRPTTSNPQTSFPTAPPFASDGGNEVIDKESSINCPIKSSQNKIQMKRNYRTVIKKYPLRRSFRKNAPFKSVQIEINETIEIPSDDNESDCHSLKRQWNSAIDDSLQPSSSKKTRKEEDLETTTAKHEKEDINHDDSKCSHQVVKFSDDHNDITVSIVNNNNLRDFPKPTRRHRLRRKTVLQLDGAADNSSNSAEESSNLDSSPQSNLALHIKQQSLARSSPGEKGPFKCTKCKRLYRTKDSFSRHIETCTFEIDSSSTSEEEEETNDLRKPNLFKVSVSDGVRLDDSIKSVTVSVEDEPQSKSASNLKKLEELCSSPLLSDKDSSRCENRTPGVHRQVRTSMKRPNDDRVDSPAASTDAPSSNEVFVPPVQSPLKPNPIVKKSASTKRYTNIRLYKGKQGYQYRRAAPQVPIQPQPSNNVVQIRAQQPTTNLQLALQPSVVNQTSFANTFNQSQFVNSMSPLTPIGNNLNSMNRLVTVVSGNSVAVPQGYALQYVGSYRENDTTSSSLMSYPQQPMMINPIVMTAQPAPVVVPQVMNTNITYAIAAPDGLVFNQQGTMLPSVQYVPQQTQLVTPQNLVQQQQPMMSFAASPVTQAIGPAYASIPTAVPIHNQFATVDNKGPILPCSQSPRNRPQALIAPLINTIQSGKKCENSRPLFQQTSAVVRSVATVAPAVFTTSNSIITSLAQSNCNIMSSESDCFPLSNQLGASVRPRPTYSYRDAMTDGSKPEKRLKTDGEVLQSDELEKKVTDENAVSNVEKKTNETCLPETTNSYRLVLKKDSQSGSKFNILPFNGPMLPISSPEVKEVRIKAKVSVGPKRKKPTDNVQRYWGHYGKEFIIGSKDITNEMSVNEQKVNMSPNLNANSSPIQDPSLIDKPKDTTPEPYIVFELTSEDGFKVESRHVSEVWQKVFDAVSEARINTKVKNCEEAKGKTMSGLEMLGLNHNAVQYLLEQLPGSKDCHKYSFQFHRRPTEDDEIFESTSGCARTESFKTRSPYDIFSWLASKHRKMPLPRARVLPEEIQLSTRRATSLELPMAMRYRHLRETAREAVGVFRSSIHGRGLFCKRDIDSGEMVIEYAGQVIRSCLCDMREKFYESKGIGCYMFRIDEETVIDATMHGNAARFINHSCDPNCYSRVVDILGKKHIIIFALRRIIRGEELTYDYKFPIEDDKIPCTCGARRCRKYLN